MAASDRSASSPHTVSITASSTVISRRRLRKAGSRNPRSSRQPAAASRILFQVGGILLAHVPLKEHLHRKFAGFRAERWTLFVRFFRDVVDLDELRRDGDCGRELSGRLRHFDSRPSRLRIPYCRLSARAIDRLFQRSQVSTQKIIGKPVSICANCNPRAVSEQT